MVFCRFPDGSTGGNAPAGGSGQVNLKRIPLTPTRYIFENHTLIFQGNFNNDDEDDLYS